MKDKLLKWLNENKPQSEPWAGFAEVDNGMYLVITLPQALCSAAVVFYADGTFDAQIMQQIDKMEGVRI